MTDQLHLRQACLECAGIRCQLVHMQLSHDTCSLLTRMLRDTYHQFVQRINLPTFRDKTSKYELMKRFLLSGGKIRSPPTKQGWDRCLCRTVRTVSTIQTDKNCRCDATSTKRRTTGKPLKTTLREERRICRYELGRSQCGRCS